MISNSKSINISYTFASYFFMQEKKLYLECVSILIERGEASVTKDAHSEHPGLKILIYRRGKHVI